MDLYFSKRPWMATRGEICHNKANQSISLFVAIGLYFHSLLLLQNYTPWCRKPIYNKKYPNSVPDAEAQRQNKSWQKQGCLFEFQGKDSDGHFTKVIIEVVYLHPSCPRSIHASRKLHPHPGNYYNTSEFALLIHQVRYLTPLCRAFYLAGANTLEQPL